MSAPAIQRETTVRLGPALRQGSPLWTDMTDAWRLLHSLLECADVIGERGPDGEAFMLVVVQPYEMEALAKFGAQAADMEPDDEGDWKEDLEPDHDTETCEIAGDGRYPGGMDAQRLVGA